jgi:hypothetical protein
MKGLLNARGSNGRSGLFSITTTSPFGKESSGDAHDCPVFVIAAIEDSNKAPVKTRAMLTALLTDRGAQRINIYASSEYRHRRRGAPFLGTPLRLRHFTTVDDKKSLFDDFSLNIVWRIVNGLSVKISSAC